MRVTQFSWFYCNMAQYNTLTIHYLKEKNIKRINQMICQFTQNVNFNCVKLRYVAINPRKLFFSQQRTFGVFFPQHIFNVFSRPSLSLLVIRILQIIFLKFICVLLLNGKDCVLSTNPTLPQGPYHSSLPGPPPVTDSLRKDLGGNFRYWRGAE